MKFSIDLPVQFRDIDVMGHVNNATYFQYMETARVELARKLGQVSEGFRGSFIVASARCEFKKSIRDERQITRLSVGEPDRRFLMGFRLFDPRTKKGGIRSRQDYTGSLRLQNQISNSDLWKTQKKIREVCRITLQVQRS